MIPAFALLLSLGASNTPSPTPAVPAADPARIAKARNAMQPLGRETRLGPWRVVTDAATGELAGLDAVASNLAATYAARYGLQAAPGSGEAVALYSSDARYRRFAEADGSPLFAARGHAGAGLAAFALGRTPLDGRVVAVHELTHLLSRQALGASIPAWLDEGLSEDLAWCAVDGAGRLQPDTIDVLESPKPGVQPPAAEWSGPRVAVDAWIQSVRAGRILPIPYLLSPGSRFFSDPGTRRDAWTTSAMLVRWCLAEPDRASRFRGFLRSVAKGRPGDADALAAALGMEAPELQRAFLDWVKTL